MATPSVTVTANKFDPNTQSFITTPTSIATNTPTTDSTLKSFNQSMVTPITSDSMKNTTPVPLSTPKDNTSSYLSSINQVAADLATQNTLAQQEFDRLNKEAKTQSSEIASLQSLLGEKSTDRNLTYETQGVNKLYNQLADLDAQATGLANEAKAIPIQIQNEFKGTGATDAGVAPIQSARLRDNALKALSLGQQAAIASAQYDKAKNYADQIIEAKYDKIQADINAKLTNLSALKEFDLTPAQEKARQAREEKLNAEKAANEEKKKNESDVQNLVITAASQNAPSTLVAKAKLAKNGAEAASILGMYAGDYWGTKAKIAQYNKTVAETAATYGGGASGIGTVPGKSVAQSWLAQFNSGAMSLEDIYTKIGNSKEALKLKNELANLVAAQGGKRVIPMDDAQISAIDEQIKNINDLVGENGYNYKIITGGAQGGFLGLGASLSGAKGDSLAMAKNLVNNQTLQALADAKAKGITFGALSEGELNTVAGAAGRISAKAIRDDKGNITGFSGSESEFKKDLDTLKAGLEASKQKKTGLVPFGSTASQKADVADKALSTPTESTGGYTFN